MCTIKKKTSFISAVMKLFLLNCLFHSHTNNEKIIERRQYSNTSEWNANTHFFSSIICRHVLHLSNSKSNHLERWLVWHKHQTTLQCASNHFAVCFLSFCLAQSIYLQCCSIYYSFEIRCFFLYFWFHLLLACFFVCFCINR